MKCIEATQLEKKPKVQDDAMERKAWVLKINEDPVMVHFCNTDVTPEVYKKLFCDNYINCMAAMMLKQKFGKFTMKVLEETDGVPVIHQRVEIPIPFVDPRSIIVKSYQIPCDNGFVFMLSSKDCYEQEKKYAAQIGKDVIGTLEVNYYNFQALPNGKGSKITHVICTKPNGKMPDMAINKMTSAQSKAILMLTEHIKSI